MSSALPIHLLLVQTHNLSEADTGMADSVPALEQEGVDVSVQAWPKWLAHSKSTCRPMPLTSVVQKANF